MRSDSHSHTGVLFEAACNGDDNSNTTWDSNRNSTSDSGSLYNHDEVSDTDDDYDAGPEETRSFLHRYFTLSIVARQAPGEPKQFFMKATLLHTKVEDHNPRM